MNLNIVVNKYLLMWYILFESSISEDIHALKMDIWNNKKDKYVKLKDEKDIITKDLDNYIPDDDDVFDDIETSFAYKKIKKETNKYRLMLLEIWDKSKKTYMKELTNILKVDLKNNYTVCILNPALEVSEVDTDNKVITIGKKLSIKEKDDFLTYLIYKIIKRDLLNIEAKDKYILSTVVELAITNELYTRVTKESKFNLGKKELKIVKNLIYPYWLMYLGVDIKDFEKHMIRDSIMFNIEKYEYDKSLKDLNIFEFIDYVIKNKKIIFNKDKMKL